MTKELRDSARRTHTLKLATLGRIVVNKVTYVLVRALTSKPQDGWLHSPWHWYRFPFSLRNHLLWSPSLQCWFCPQDESAMECMLHLPSNEDRKSTRLNSSHGYISYAVFCLKKKKKIKITYTILLQQTVM